MHVQQKKQQQQKRLNRKCVNKKIWHGWIFRSSNMAFHFRLRKCTLSICTFLFFGLNNVFSLHLQSKHSFFLLSVFLSHPFPAPAPFFIYPFPSPVCADTPLHSPRVEEQRDWLVWCLLEVIESRGGGREGLWMKRLRTCQTKCKSKTGVGLKSHFVIIRVHKCMFCLSYM